MSARILIFLRATLIVVTPLLVVPIPAAFAQKKGQKTELGKEKNKKQKDKGGMDEELFQQVHGVLERATRSGDRETRASAVEHFGPLRPAETLPYAVDALKDPVAEVRLAAIRALIRIGDVLNFTGALLNEMSNPQLDMETQIMPILAMLTDKDAVALAHKLVHDQKATTQSAVIEAFAKLGGPRMIAFFRPLLTDKDQALAETAQNVVIAMKTLEALPLYADVIQSGNSEVQKRALDALKELPAGAKLPFVSKLLKSKDEELRMRAAETLAFHGDRSVASELEPILDGTDEKAIIRALDAMGKIASKDMYGPILSFLRRRDTNPEIIRRCLEIHYRTNDAEITSTIRLLLRNDNVKTQAVAVYYLGLMEKGRALTTLHEDLFHGDANVRQAAAMAIGTIGSRESIASLQRALDDTREAELRVELVKALANIKDKDIIPVVGFLITDPIPEVRRWAIIALTRVGHVGAVPSLRIAINDADIGARAEAVKAIVQLDKAEGLSAFRQGLGWLPPAQLLDLAETTKEEILPYLDIALTSDRAEIRAAAMEILSRYPQHQGTILNAALARSQSTELKVAILQRLAEVNGSAELERLQKLTDDRDLALKVAGLRLLGEVGDMAADPVLRKALFDSQEKARVAAAVALVRLFDVAGQKGKQRGKKAGK